MASFGGSSASRNFERDGGVYIELEAIGLSRDIPASLRWIVVPIVRRVSRGPLSTSLQQTENAVLLQVALAKRKPVSRELTAETVHEHTGTEEFRALHLSK